MKTLKALALISAMSCGLSQTTYAQRTIHLNPCVFPMDQDNFSSASPWTVIDPITTGNGSIIVNTSSSCIQFSQLEGSSSACAATGQSGACSNREMRVYRPLAATLSNSTWRAEFTIRIDNGNAPNHGLLGFTAGTADPEGNYSPASSWSCGSGSGSTGSWIPANQDGIFASLIAFGSAQLPGSFSDKPFTLANQTLAANATTTAGWCIYGHGKKGNGSFYPSSPFSSAQLNWSWGIPLPNIKIPYYLRLERINPNECMISVFSDAARTVHVPGSPQCFQIDPTIGGLNTVQDFTHQSGSFMRNLLGNVSDFAVYDGCPAIPTLTLTATPAAACSAGSTTLTATPGFQSYTWMPGNITTTTNTLAVNPSTTTTYSVYATYSGYPCQIISSTVSVAPNPTYITFNPDFTISATLPAGATSFSAVATPITGSQNADIYAAGAGYGYLWSVDMIDPVTSSVLCTITNPSNWWNSAVNNYFPGYSSGSGTCANSGVTSGIGWFDASYKYRFTRGVWNPCTYSSISKTVSLCTNCKTADGKPRFIVEEETSRSGPNTTHPRDENGTPASNGSSVAENHDLSVAPNPHNGQFTLFVNNHDAAYTYEVYDMLGHLVLSGNSKDPKQTISMPDNSKGVYILKVTIDGTLLTKRLIQQ